MGNPRILKGQREPIGISFSKTHKLFYHSKLKMSRCSSAPTWFSPTGHNPVVSDTSEQHLASLAQQARAACTVNGQAEACAQAVYSYALHNQVRASNVGTSAAPSQSTNSILLRPVRSMGPINDTQFRELARLSTSQQMAQDMFYETPVGLQSQPSSDCYTTAGVMQTP